MTTRPPVVVYDENTDRELRQTRHVVKSLDPATRYDAARCFVGWRVVVELDSHMSLEGWCEGVARMHGGGCSDVILLTHRPDTHDLANMHAYPLATVRSIKTLGRMP